MDLDVCLYEFSRRGNYMLPRRIMMLATLRKHFYATFSLYCFASNFPILVSADQSKNDFKACVHQVGERRRISQADVANKVKVNLEYSTNGKTYY